MSFDRDRRKVVDEGERVLDLVGDAGSQLAERRRASPSEPGDPVQFAISSEASTFWNKRAFSIATADCAAKVLIKSTILCGKVPDARRRAAGIPTIQQQRQQHAMVAAIGTGDAFSKRLRLRRLARSCAE